MISLKVQVDPDEELGLKGLTKEMIEILKNAGVNKDEILSDSKNFISVLENYDEDFMV